MSEDLNLDVSQVISDAWSWNDVNGPLEVLHRNAFGNFIFKDSSNSYWRLCPEELTYEIIAKSKSEAEYLFKDPEFIHDWNMRALVEKAEAKLGRLESHECYALITPACLGGEYHPSNFMKVPFVEIIKFSGDVALQIKDLPDGAQIELKIVP